MAPTTWRREDRLVVGPLLNSKYRLPTRRPGAIPRGRLTQRLRAASRSTLTVVSAPAGFGKTTLLTELLDAASGDGAAVAWLALDRRDNDPALFLTYVVTAVQSAVAGIGDGALQLLASSSPPMDAVLATLLNDLDGLSTDLLLVLDDYHLVETRAVHEAMTFLLEHQPPQLHIALAKNSNPPFLVLDQGEGRDLP